MSRRSAIAFAVSVCFALTAFGPTGAQVPEPPNSVLEQVDLDGPAIEKFLETWGVISAEIEQRDAEFDASDSETLVEQLQQLARSSATDAAMDEIVRQHGFASFRDWVLSSYSILVARHWLENPPDAEEFAKAQKTIETMEGMSEEQKRDMLAGLRDAVGVVSEMEPPAENRKAVEPYIDAIRSVIDPDGSEG